MPRDDLRSIILLKTIIREYTRKVKKVLYYNKDLSVATYEKLAFSIDSLNMLLISVDWHSEIRKTIWNKSLNEELENSLISIIDLLKQMIMRVEKGEIKDDDFEKFNECLENALKGIGSVNRRYVEVMITQH